MSNGTSFWVLTKVLSLKWSKCFEFQQSESPREIEQIKLNKS